MSTFDKCSCPNCHSVGIRRSRRKGRGEIWLRIIGVRPYRCTSCFWRGYGRPRPDGSFSMLPLSESDLARATTLLTQGAILVAAVAVSILIFSRLI